MEEGTFSKWLKSAGEQVQAGEPLFAVESDKVTMDVESIDSGILYLPADAPTAGAVVKVGQLIGYLLAQGEAPPAEMSRHAEGAPDRERTRRRLVEHSGKR